MSVVRTGTTVKLTATSSGSQSITFPADATLAIFFVAGYICHRGRL